MGSEGRSKKRRASGSEEEGRSKRHRSRDEKDRKSRKSEKEKKKSKKSHKHSKSSDKGVKSSKKQDREYSKGASHSFEEISEDDYFSKNNEFSTWLKEERRQFFSDLSSEEAHILFSSFIKEWNGRKLQPRYYEGIATGPRTSHNWKIAHGK